LAPVGRSLMRARHYLLILALAFGIPTVQTLSSFDNTLRALHAPDRPSYGVSALTGIGFDPKADKPRDVVDVWRQADAQWQAGRTHAPENVTTVLRNYLLVDTLFMLCYGVGLLVLALTLRRRITELVETGEERVERLARGQDQEQARWSLAEQIRLARQSLLGAAVATPLIVVADVVEDICSWQLGSHTAAHWQQHGTLLHGLFWIGFASSWTKTAILVGVVLALLVGALWVAVIDSASARKSFRAAIVLRGQIALLLLLAFIFFGPVTADQAADAMLRWKDRHWEAGYALALTALLGVLLWLGARELVRTKRQTARFRGIDMLALAIAVGLLAFGVSVWIWKSNWNATTYIALGAAALGLWLVNLWARHLEPQPPKSYGAAQRIPAILLGAPLVLLGIALLRPALVERTYAQRTEYTDLVLLAVGAQFVGWMLIFAAWLLRNHEDAYLRRVILLTLSVTALLSLTAAVWTEPIEFPIALGTIGVVVAWLTAVSGVVFALAWWSERSPPAPVFALLRLRRTPVFVVVLAWAMIAGSTQKGDYYNARTLPGKPTTVKVDDVFAAWKERLHLAKQKRPQMPKGVKPGIPMVFVATAGGGIRASYWTALSLQCIFESTESDCTKPKPATDPRPYFFAASGVSGGSVGLAHYIAHVVSGETAQDWPTKHAGDDEASATLAWFLFADIPSAFVSRTGGSDRAEMLERAWERSWPSGALSKRLDLADAIKPNGPPVPLTLLNGTRVQDGCRINVSILKGTAAAGGDDNRISDCLTVRAFRQDAPNPSWTFASTQDVHAYLCDSSLRLSTAALLSARFPWVSPSGRLDPCDSKASTLVPANVVDGGYFDTSAASTVVELWDHLQPEVARFNMDTKEEWCLVPLLIELDNHYAGFPAASARKAWETNAPLATVQAARNAREANARQAAALAFAGSLGATQEAVLVEHERQPSALLRFAELRPAAHPGTEAPLGWALSQASIDDLRNELTGSSPARNPAVVNQIHQWLKPGSIGCRKRPTKATRPN
jgi:hypothetical protein